MEKIICKPCEEDLYNTILCHNLLSETTNNLQLIKHKGDPKDPRDIEATEKYGGRY
jgi:hypothetical protein